MRGVNVGGLRALLRQPGSGFKLHDQVPSPPEDSGISYTMISVYINQKNIYQLWFISLPLQTYCISLFH